MPLISVIVPCYNQAQYLDECLQSVLDQTYQDWECIIVNDGSPDNTEEVANQWLAKDSRFKYLYKENGGLSSARNAGINEAEGEWILPLDSDDFISLDYLDLGQKYFYNQTVKVIYCEAQKFGKVNEAWKLPIFSLANLAANNVIFCTAFFRKRDWSILGGYDENLLTGIEDWEFWISLLKNGGEVIKIEKTCFFYRIKDNSMITNLSKTNNFELVKYVEKKHFDFFYYYFGSSRHLYNQNKQYEKLIDLMTQKRRLSRWVNQIYSFFENQ